VLGVDHHVFNYTEEFERHVVTPFVEGHARGESPNPCIECNRHIKFDLLFERAERLGFDAVATGHHAQVIERDGHFYLVRGADERKDQSYVLGYLREEQLAKLILPIGHMNKDAVRAEAERVGLRTWNKPDSQDVCFIEASKGREDFLSSRIEMTTADIVDRASGQVVGSTRAAELLTLGQRRGVMPGRDGEKRFVAKVDLPNRRVEVGRLEDILVTTIALDSESFTPARQEPTAGTTYFAQWSAHGRPQPVTLEKDDQGWFVTLETPARAIAAGQSVVLYNRDEPSIVEVAALVVSR
jgi:tRNA-specific 2-thiouridylase